MRIHASFRFSAEGKIDSTLCEPALQNPHGGCAC
jgi:hypothetical protein